MSSLACALKSVQGERVALTYVSVSAVLHDLLAEVTMCQSYRNEEQVNIEAVYTFPLPLDAVLLDLQVEIGGRVLKGVVVEKKAAEEKYEDAIAAGDAAVMLEQLEPGLYTMNVGNILPNEDATIKFRYSILYRWVDERLRLFIPMHPIRRPNLRWQRRTTSRFGWKSSEA
jgi:Ca-activated chloride channel family protein